MANSIGARAVAYVNGYDLSSGISQTDVDYSEDAVDVTPFGQTARTFISGLENATLSVTGYYDSSAGAIDNVLSNMIGGTACWVIYEQGDVAGNRGHGIYGFETDYKVTAPVASAIGVTASAQSNAGPEGLTSIAAKQAFGFTAAGTTNTALIDFGTAMSGGSVSTGGGQGWLQCFAGSGVANITVTLQHGTVVGAMNNLTSFSTFAATSAPTYQYLPVSVAGTSLFEFMRAHVVADGAGTVTLAVGFTRNP